MRGKRVQYVQTMMSGNARVKGKYSAPLGIIQRGPYRLFYKYMQNLLGVDEKRCIKCGLCAKTVPFRQHQNGRDCKASWAL